jgi:hypothetical protein
MSTKSQFPQDYQPLNWRQDYDKNIAVPALQFSMPKIYNWELGLENLLYQYHLKPTTPWQKLVNRMNKIQRKLNHQRAIDKNFSTIKNPDQRDIVRFSNEQRLREQSKMAIDSENQNQLSLNYLGLANYGESLANFESRFMGLETADRLGHTVITGNSGFGKSCLISNMFYQDILQGYGGVLITSDDRMCNKIINSLPKEFQDRLIYLVPGNPKYEFGIDIFDSPKPETALETVISIFSSIWQGEATDKISYFLEPILALIRDNLDSVGLGDYARIINDHKFRVSLLENFKEPKVVNFWNGLKSTDQKEIFSTLIKLEYINRNKVRQLRPTTTNSNKAILHM